MNMTSGIPTQTALEYLIALSGKSISEVCRALDVTPQQFSDWTKKRRPIPAQRLARLTDYFGVAPATLADAHRYAEDISALSAIQLELFVIQTLQKVYTQGEESEALAQQAKELSEAFEKQQRITRFTALVSSASPAMLSKIDTLLDTLEKAAKEKAPDLPTL